MKFELTTRALTALRADAYIVFLFEGESIPKSFGAAAQRQLEDQAARERFVAKQGTTLAVTLGQGAEQRTVIVAGLGPKALPRPAVLRDAAAAAGRRALQDRARRIAMRLPAVPAREQESATGALIFGLAMGQYKFQRYITDRTKQVVAADRLILSVGQLSDAIERGRQRAEALIAGCSLARDLVNEPAARITPRALGREATRLARRHKLRLKLMTRPQLERERMGALLAVAQGSVEPPCVAHLIYRPRRSPKARLAFIGKGVTFDSGGYDIKASEHMLDMKCDMAGAAAVLGAMESIARLRPDVEVHGLFGAVENLVSGNAFKPGDVLQTRAGKTVEVNNTDAEGRLVLADVMHYACERVKPDLMIDLATLTGACVVALGSQISGLMSPQAATRQRVLEAAERAGEKMWALPLPEEYWELMKSPIADMRNTGPRYGGALTAGLFLQQFVDPAVAWCHLDIAGPAFLDADHPFWGRGGTGAGVATLVELASS
jgi:leucyl aminopeptidase